MKGLVQGRPELQLLPPLSTAHGSQGQQCLLNKAAPSYPLAPAAPAHAFLMSGQDGATPGTGGPGHELPTPSNPACWGPVWGGRGHSVRMMTLE